MIHTKTAPKDWNCACILQPAAAFVHQFNASVYLSRCIANISKFSWKSSMSGIAMVSPTAIACLLFVTPPDENSRPASADTPTWQWRRWRRGRSSAVAAVPSTSGRRWCRRSRIWRSTAWECCRASAACRAVALPGYACLQQQHSPSSPSVMIHQYHVKNAHVKYWTLASDESRIRVSAREKI